MYSGGLKLTKRGERLVAYTTLAAFLLIMGFVGWLETLGMPGH
jgi:hypothetical protein